MDFKYKTVAELNAMSDDEREKYLSDKRTYEDEVRKKEIEKALAPILDANKSTSEQIKEIAEDVASMTEKIKVSMDDNAKNYLYNTLKEKHQDFVDAFKSGQKIEIQVEKVAEMHMTNNGTVTNASGVTYPLNDNFSIDGNVAHIRVPENFILGVISNRQVAGLPPAQKFKRQQMPREGAVALTAEGAIKPLLQYKYQNTATSRQKYAGRIEWTEEFEQDFDSLFADVVRMFERDVLTAWQDGVISIILANATSYVASSLDGTLVQADNGLAVVAVLQQIRALNYTPNYVVMNPADVDAAVYTQDKDGNFQLKPYIDASGNRIAGVRLIQSNKVAAGTFYAGDFTVYTEEHSRYIFRTGYYNDQFIKNEWTAIGEVFSILSIAPIDMKAIVKGNFATIKASLNKA